MFLILVMMENLAPLILVMLLLDCAFIPKVLIAVLHAKQPSIALNGEPTTISQINANNHFVIKPKELALQFLHLMQQNALYQIATKYVHPPNAKPSLVLMIKPRKLFALLKTWIATITTLAQQILAILTLDVFTHGSIVILANNAPKIPIVLIGQPNWDLATLSLAILPKINALRKL
jgi:hypothetical protein